MAAPQKATVRTAYEIIITLTWMVRSGPFWRAGMSGTMSEGKSEAMPSMPATMGRASEAEAAVADVGFEGEVGGGDAEGEGGREFVEVRNRGVARSGPAGGHLPAQEDDGESR